MIRVESYLLVDKQFIPVESFTGRVPDPHYIEGAIQLEINGVMVLTLELYDYVDQLWSYVANGLIKLTTQQSWKTYFPDQPIELSFRTDERRQRVTVEATPSKGRVTASASYDEFMTVMSEAGQQFFRRMIELVPENRTANELVLRDLQSIAAKVVG